MHKIHKCGHGWRNTMWRTADWIPTFYTVVATRNISLGF